MINIPRIIIFQAMLFLKLFSSAPFYLTKIKIYRANLSLLAQKFIPGQEFITYPISTRIPTNSFKIIRETRPSRARRKINFNIEQPSWILDVFLHGFGWQFSHASTKKYEPPINFMIQNVQNRGLKRGKKKKIFISLSLPAIPVIHHSKWTNPVG